MKTFKNVALALALAATFVAPCAQANQISSTVNISTTNSVKYVTFNVTTAGGFDIRGLGDDSFDPSSLWNNDPEIYLFKNSLTAANLLAHDDDSGDGPESLIDNIELYVGKYILAVSEYDFTLSEAISGSNAKDLFGLVIGINDPGSIKIEIEGDSFRTGTGQNRRTITAGNAALASLAVPEPDTIALMGLALLGLGFSRKQGKKQK